MNVVERVEQARASLKVFPLPPVVLFPNAIVPLHIFEPRYRQMVRDALDGDQLIVMAGYEEGWSGGDDSKAPLSPIACVGSIVWNEKTSDGRYNLLLQGVVRVKLLEERDVDTPYRQVRGEVLTDPSYDGPENELLRQAMLELSGGLPPQVLEPLLQIAIHLEGGALADVIAGTLVQERDRRAALLAELDVSTRLQMVLEDVGELLLRLGPSELPSLPN